MTYESKPISGVRLHKKSGRLCRASGPLIRSTGDFHVGEVCTISRKRRERLLAEVVGVDGSEVILTPYGSLDGISNRSEVNSLMDQFSVPVGQDLVGRVLDALGNPMDDGPNLQPVQHYPINGAPPDPMARPVIADVFSLGIRALDGIITCGVGQRLGIFAAAGGGKSTLLSMIARFAQCDRIVIALIGERGREVQEFIQDSLGAEGLAKSVLVVATSDRPAIEQVNAAYTATAIAEYFRDSGQKVLLLVDSLTRFARAQRQIGLAAGEPPTRRGYPPSLFERLPALLERAGKTEKGSITALYTVLVEGDDMSEPVADETRSLLDGHIVLSKDLAEKGHYPAIEVTASISRLFQKLVDDQHSEAATKLKFLISKYTEIELLLQVGEYSKGSDKDADDAIAYKDVIDKFLQQKTHEHADFTDTRNKLLDLF